MRKGRKIVFVPLLVGRVSVSIIVANYSTIIPWARVGYEMIDSQRGAQRRVGYNHLISNKREWNNCFIKNTPQIKKTRLQ